ncbi:MAG: D-alanyl-D-alanine carboxypeptidase [Rhizobiales bacterium]|nr:D-alanyl-D-alanine carboxypeptidase [Hyphomicrobiales bacterium]
MCDFFLTRTVKNILKLSSTVILAFLISVSAINYANAYNKPRYSSVIIDVNNGKTIHAKNATSLRYPASLTKIMTLYMLFEELKQGRVKKWTRLSVSRHATRQQPSKLYLKKGSYITVEDAIKALVTKSANDVAVVIAEHIGGTESRFAVKMTKVARSIGMRNTVFKNASGLPNKRQVTTAKDMAILGINIQRRFPTYYKYFKTRVFTYKGVRYGNHNKLLGKYRGVDGIKTGYTHASGFNLVSSVRRDGKHVVAVVIGAKSGRSRNLHMEQLLNKAMPKLTTRKISRPAPRRKLAKVTKPTRPTKRPAITVNNVQVASAGRNRLTANLAQMPKTLRGGLTSADKALNAHRSTSNQPIKISKNNMSYVATNNKPAKDQSRIGTGNNNIINPIAYAPIISTTGKTNLSSQGKRLIALSTAHLVKDKKSRSITSAKIVTAKLLKDSWAVQIGAYANHDDAKNQLDQMSKFMTPYDAKYYIPSVKKGNKAIYRARFAGLSKSYAKKACNTIKSKGFSCLALKNN